MFETVQEGILCITFSVHVIVQSTFHYELSFLRVLWNNKVINLGMDLYKQVSESSVTLKCEGILTRSKIQYMDKSCVMQGILGETYKDFFVRCLIVFLIHSINPRNW